MRTSKLVSSGALLFLALLTTSSHARCPGLKALGGKCADPLIVEDAQQRAMVVTTVRNSYFGTPIGTIGGAYIPFERLFRDDPLVFGLPTYKYFSYDTGTGDNFVRYTR